ncbi:glycosyltransferase family 4 protein [Marivibrio halodurans]|uniref:Glycosyltransferase family 4 protein n=1 Tax=Marivibrio halodurans TaxID=2039722 RepID=A0A8J7V2V4_9PROT|nr:glycosyltransferase family 4 protein [Marivibrio halodurans]
MTEDWYFLSHRLPLARAARDAGARVVVATRINDARARLEAEGFTVVPIPFDRSGLDPLRDLATIRAIHACYRRHAPDIVHHVAMKPTLYGTLAGYLAGVPHIVNAMAGMGFLFISQGIKARLLRPAIRAAMRLANRGRRVRVIVQNDDDRDLFRAHLGVPDRRIATIRGSGVDVDALRPAPEPAVDDGHPPVALCLSRMLWDKGIGELVEAARLLRRRGVPLTIRLVGPGDANPAAIDPEQLQAWTREGLVESLGRTADIAGAYAASHIAVLPSYREGLPKSLLEAAACGRPIVATDVPGCREICVEGETGLRVPARAVEPLADALQRLAADPALRARMGAAARRMAETRFATDRIVAETLALYTTMLAGRGDIRA